LGITDSTFVFEGPGFSASDGGVRHFGSTVAVLSRSLSILVAGSGKCPNGPASALAVDFSHFPFRLFRLRDMSP